MFRFSVDAVASSVEGIVAFWRPLGWKIASKCLRSYPYVLSGLGELANHNL